VSITLYLRVGKVGTRCVIEMRQGGSAYRIYRHWDGYPEGVLADIKVLLEEVPEAKYRFKADPEYFLAMFIFYAKLTDYERTKGTRHFANFTWDYGYGVCSLNCQHGDLDYFYSIDCDKGKIEIYEVCGSEMKLLFKGPIEKAIKRFVPPELSNGCHIYAEVLKKIKEDGERWAKQEAKVVA